MVLDALILLKERDPLLSFVVLAKGVLCSDGFNMNGNKNGPSFVSTPLIALKAIIYGSPLPGVPGTWKLVVGY